MRFAPTVSGRLHLGSLWNALLNFLYARKHSGVFNLRLDGHYIRGERISDRDSILEDLKIFGLEWDNLIRQEDFLGEHISSFKKLVTDNPNRFYECDCTINDIAKRNLFPSDRKMYRLLRPEKYPRPCRLQKIEIFNTDNINIALNQKITASNSARDCSVDILTSDKGDYSLFWSNTDIGKLDSPEKTSLFIKLEKLQTICSMQLTFREYPFLDYQIYIKANDEWKPVAFVSKPVEYFVEPRPAVPYPIGLPERINFAPVETDSVRIEITRLPLPLDRPYHYDYNCKSMGKKLDWADLKTVIRCHYDGETFLNYLDFVTKARIPHKRMEIDTAAWFDGKPDLVFSSPYDDQKMGATHLIRGNDIYAFMFMEVQITRLLNYNPVYHYHSMIVDKENVKYSKFIKSPSISSYLTDKITPGKIIGYLAWKGGIVNSFPGEVKATDLAPSFDLTTIPKENIVIDDKEMIDFLST